MSESSDSTLGRRARHRSVAYAGLVAMMALAAGASLWISAPAWWPGAPGLHRPQRFEELRAATVGLYQRQRERLSRYQWRDRAAGQVAIPIERAMELMVNEPASAREGQP